MTVKTAPVIEGPVQHTSIASMQLRCESGLQGILKEYPDGKWLLEVRCKNQRCSERGAGMVVLHYFDIKTGELNHTRKFRDPRRQRQNGRSDNNENH